MSIHQNMSINLVYYGSCEEKSKYNIVFGILIIYARSKLVMINVFLESYSIIIFL